MRKKNKQEPSEINFTVNCEINQTSPSPVQPVYMDFWDTVDLKFTMSISGAILDSKDDPEFRRKVKERVLERFDQLFDAVHVNDPR